MDSRQAGSVAVKIPLSQGLFALIDEEDLPLVEGFDWYAARSGSSGKVYAVARVRLHRLLMNAPDGFFVDHKSGDTLDNRKENLRLATNAQNQANTGPRGGTSRFKGVSWSARRKKWLAMFLADGVTHYLGYFHDEEEAARAVDRRRLQVSGEFARLNFPPEE